LPEFLKDHVVDATDVSDVLAQVEPPYPGYRRTIQALATYLERAKEYDGKPLPAFGKTIVPGDSYPTSPSSPNYSGCWATFPLKQLFRPTGLCIKVCWWPQSKIFSAGTVATRTDVSVSKRWPI